VLDIIDSDGFHTYRLKRFAEVLKLNKTLKEVDISCRIYKKCECDLEEVDEANASTLEIIQGSQ